MLLTLQQKPEQGRRIHSTGPHAAWWPLDGHSCCKQQGPPCFENLFLPRNKGKLAGPRFKAWYRCNTPRPVKPSCAKFINGPQACLFHSCV